MPPRKSALSSGPPEHVLTVDELATAIKSNLEVQFQGVAVLGEISNFVKAASGHCYFSLKDSKAQLRSVMFKFAARKVAFQPDNGLEVICIGRVSFYTPRGECQIVVEEMMPKGVGALQLAFEQLREKLENEGLFDGERKRPLPFLPRKVGVVTSPSGAAIHDIIRVISRRFPNMEVLLCPALVQGDKAPPEIIAGIETLNRRDDVDVLIVGRGGGSLEDLWAFNDEGVARAIAASRLPVVSAVGHEVDVTIADLVADRRAATPSQAAELVVPERAALVNTIDVYNRRLAQQASMPLRRHEGLRRGETQRSLVLMAQEAISRRLQRLDDVTSRALRQTEKHLERLQRRGAKASQSMAYLSPQAVVRRAKDRQEDLERRLRRAGAEMLLSPQVRLRQASRMVEALQPARQLLSEGRRVAQLERRLVNEMRDALKRRRERLAGRAEILRELSHESVTRRGYAVVLKGRRTLRSAKQLKLGDEFEARLHRGTVFGKVTGIQKDLELFSSSSDDKDA